MVAIRACGTSRRKALGLHTVRNLGLAANVPWYQLIVVWLQPTSLRIRFIVHMRAARCA